MKVRFVDYGLKGKSYRKEMLKEMRRVLDAGDLILRKDIEVFEENLEKFVGTKYAVALSSGTDALYLSIKALKLEGKRVVLPSHTFKATCGAVLNARAFPYIYDQDDEFKLAADAWIIVHIAGEIVNFTKPDSLPVIEDACQAFGAIKNPTTSVQCWSFYPAKILGGFGDGGAITTNDESIYEYIKEARNHFKTDNRDFGGNYRMDNLQAALLNLKIKYIDEILARRKEIAEMYLAKLKGIILPNNQEGRVWQDFIIRTEKRDQLYNFLKENGVETMKNEYPFSPEYPKLPLAAKYEAETLRLPCNENLKNREVNYVIKKVNEFFNV